MSHILSEALATLSSKTKSVEDRIEHANAENKEKLEAIIAEANADTKKNEFKAKEDATKADVNVKISSAKKFIYEKLLN